MDKTIIEGFVLFNKESKEYLDESGYLDTHIDNAIWWGKKEDAEWTRVNTLDYPEEFIVKKLKITYEIEE